MIRANGNPRYHLILFSSCCYGLSRILLRAHFIRSARSVTGRTQTLFTFSVYQVPLEFIKLDVFDTFVFDEFKVFFRG